MCVGGVSCSKAVPVFSLRPRLLAAGAMAFSSTPGGCGPEIGYPVSHCLRLALPLPLWLRHCLCFAFPLPSLDVSTAPVATTLATALTRLRQCICFAF